MNELPTPPSGSWWVITGTPQGPWVWSSGIQWNENANGYAVSAEPWAVASAPGASAIWRVGSDD